MSHALLIGFLLTLIVLGIACAQESSVTVPSEMAVSAPPVRVSTLTRACMEPCAMWVLVTIERDALNRGFYLRVVGPKSRASYRQLEGELASRTHQFFYDNLPGGDYDVEVLVFRADGSEKRAATTLQVMGRGIGGQL